MDKGKERLMRNDLSDYYERMFLKDTVEAIEAENKLAELTGLSKEKLFPYMQIAKFTTVTFKKDGTVMFGPIIGKSGIVVER